MTASELIQQLKTLPPDIKIMIRGYEDGYNDILMLKPIKIKPLENAPWYSGEYENSNDNDAISAVDLFGENKNPKDEL
jgi:hypothetical protein